MANFEDKKPALEEEASLVSVCRSKICKLRKRRSWVPKPWKIKMLNLEPQKLRFGSEDFPFQFGDFRFHVLIFRGGNTVDGRNPKQPPGMVLKPCK